MIYRKAILIMLIIVLYSSQTQAQIQVQVQRHQMQMQTQMLQQVQARTAANAMGSSSKTDAKYKFNVITLSGDTIFSKTKSKILFRNPVYSITIKSDKGEYVYTTECAKEIYTIKGKENIQGVSYKDFWVFNTYSTEDVKFYAPFPEKEINYIFLYQQGDEAIKPIDVECMERLTQGNSKAEKALRKKDIHKAITIYLKDEKTKRR